MVPARPKTLLTTKRTSALPARAGRSCSMSLATTSGSPRLTRKLWIALPMNPGVRNRFTLVAGPMIARSSASSTTKPVRLERSHGSPGVATRVAPGAGCWAAATGGARQATASKTPTARMIGRTRSSLTPLHRLAAGTVSTETVRTASRPLRHGARGRRATSPALRAWEEKKRLASPPPCLFTGEVAAKPSEGAQGRKLDRPSFACAAPPLPPPQQMCNGNRVIDLRPWPPRAR